MLNYSCLIVPLLMSFTPKQLALINNRPCYFTDHINTPDVSLTQYYTLIRNISVTTYEKVTFKTLEEPRDPRWKIQNRRFGPKVKGRNEP